MASTAHHGIHRLNRHRQVQRNELRAERVASYLNKLKAQKSQSNGPNHVNQQFRRQETLPKDIDALTPFLPSEYIPIVDETPRKALIIDEPGNDESLLRVNVGGSPFTFRKETLLKRDIGLIHQPMHLCPQDLLDELAFWKISPEPYLAECCCMDDQTDDESEFGSSDDDSEAPLNEFKNVVLGDLRRAVWCIIEEPNSSMYAQIFAGLSVLFVLISISGLVMGSLAELQVPVTKTNYTGNGSTGVIIIDMEPHPYLQRLEYVCIVWFAFEYFSKMIVSSNRVRTFCKILNIIDLLAILPFMIEMGLLLFGIDTEQLQDLKGAFLVVRILRVLRVIRVLKLGRYSSGLQLFGKTLHASCRQLGMMFMVVLTGVIFFSTLIYFLEKDEPGSPFNSIPAACWFSIVTMTTVGYGDMVPLTLGGKLVATGAIAAGVLVLALPITIIVDNFMKVAESERSSAITPQPGIRRLGPRARVVVE
ncbi:Protein KVS-4 a [Aphelenchoides avenae]|nr:Protein KVS-4 a [Aphelenchus avenae]